MTLEEQLATLLQMSLRYVLQVRLVNHFAGAKEIVDRDVESMAARYRAGAARLAEMRQARLTGLEVESRLTQAERQRDLIGEAMNTQFNIRPQDAEELVDSFITSRPDVSPVIDGMDTSQARLIKHNVDKTRAETELLRAERRPVFTGQLAQVSLSAYDVSRYGNLEGHVQRIAQNTTQEKDAPPYYQTMIAIPEPILSKSNTMVDIVPGMTVMVDIIGQKRTVLNYIMTPLNRAAGVVFREN